MIDVPWHMSLISRDMLNSSVSSLSDKALESTLAGLVRRERGITAELISHLVEFDARRLYLGAGFSSLFTYCCEVLKLSEGEAYNRIEAARTARRFPQVLDRLREGSLNLTTARLLAPHLTDDNHAHLLAAASGKSKRAVEELLAGEFPRPAVVASVRKLPTPGNQNGALSTHPPPSLGRSGDGQGRGTGAPSLQPPGPQADVVPLSAAQFHVRFTASASTRDKLREAQDLLRHSIPNGDVAQIIDQALGVLLEQLRRRKFAATNRPRSSKDPATRSRHVPATVKRVVWARDGGRCAFVGKGGRRCNERAFLEFHHVDPYALDQTASIDGIELRCRPHNAYEATLYFGPWPGETKPATSSGTSSSASATAQ